MKKQDWEKEIRKNVIYDEAETGSPWDIDDLVAYVQKQLTKAYNKGKREGAKGLASYLDTKCDVKHYEDGTVEMLLPTTRGSFSISAKEYLKSLKDKK